MHVRANQPTCVCDLQLVTLLISLHIQCRTPVSNSCFHVLGTDYQRYENEGTVSSICSVKVVILMSRIKGAQCVMAAPVTSSPGLLAPCSALTPAGRCGTHIGPEFTQLFFVTPHTPLRSSSPDLCFAMVRLLFPVG